MNEKRRKLRRLDAVLSADLSVQCSNGEVILNSAETGDINTGAKCKTMPKGEYLTMGTESLIQKSDLSTMDWCTSCLGCWTGKWVAGGCALNRYCGGKGCR